MAQLKITAMTGLRQESHSKTDHVWDEFYTEENRQQPTRLEKDKAEIKVENEATYEDDFEDGDEDEDSKMEKTHAVPHIHVEKAHNALHPLADLSSQCSSTEQLDALDGSRQGKPGRVRRRKGGASAKPPPLNLYQDQVKRRLNPTRERSASANRDAQSDQEDGRRRGGRRKLHRRGQMKKYHSLEQEVEKAGRDQLEVKLLELEELMSRPLGDLRGLHGSAHLTPGPGVPRGLAGKGRRSKPEARDSVGAWAEGVVQEEETTDRQAYTTLRKLQTMGPAAQDHPTGQKSANPPPTSHNSRLTTKPPIPQRRRDSVDSSPGSSSRGSHRNEDEGEQGQKRHGDSDSDGSEGSKKFGDVSPRSVYLPADMHLKYSDNPKLLEWLRRKNRQHRQARRVERAKKREERDKQLIETEMKAARREKSSERVKQWMDMKRKEAAKQQREERKKRRQDAQNEATLRAKHNESSVRGRCLDRPQSAPAPAHNHVPIRRPESATRLENGAYTAPKPPDSSSKFVYKRPVSGRVRLMKLQNEKNGKARKEKREEDLSPEEKEKKMRLSYDMWLLTKRKEDVEKRKEAKRQEELIKSDPEMQRLIPQVAERRIEMIESEKKSIDTGMSDINDAVNHRFGGGSFGTKGSKEEGEASTGRPSSYGLSVEGSVATLVELNMRARPASAKTRMPIPQSAFSPRRPQLAKPSRDSSPKVRTVMATDHATLPNPFSLPFSDELGMPLHVKRVQERIFSRQMASQSTGSQRPEPQGCASESAACPKDVADSSRDLLPAGPSDVPDPKTEVLPGCPKDVADPKTEVCNAVPGDLPEGPKQEVFLTAVDPSTAPDSAPRASLVLLQQIEEAAIQSEEGTQQAATAVDCSAGKREGVTPGSTPVMADSSAGKTDGETLGSRPLTDKREASLTEPASASQLPDAALNTAAIAEGNVSTEEKGMRDKDGGDDEDRSEVDKSQGQRDRTAENKDSSVSPQSISTESVSPQSVSHQGAVQSQAENGPESTIQAQDGLSSDQSEANAPSIAAKSSDPEARDSVPEDPQQCAKDLKSCSSPFSSSAVDGLASEAGSEDPEDRTGSTSRSMKRVSFSEDLATVFETTSAETSSNFDDERGLDDAEGEHFLSLDDVPDPE